MGQIDGLLFHKDLGDGARVRLFFNEYGGELYRLCGYKRLIALERRGYIRGNFISTFPKLYTLTDKGFSALKVAGRTQLKGHRDSMSGLLVGHELKVNAVALVLTELLGLAVRTERERFVWSGRGGWTPAPERAAISDLWIADEAQPKAVEVELSQKSATRYREIWNSYCRRLPENGVVLYLTAWPSGVRCITEHARRLGADFVYACGLKEFRDSCGRQPFTGCQPGQTLSLWKFRSTVPYAAEPYRRVPAADLSARQDASAGERPAAVPFAPPERPSAALLAPSNGGRGQFAAPPAGLSGPRPLPLLSPSPTPEGEGGAA